MSAEGKTQTGPSGSAKPPLRRRRTRVNDKKIADDEFMAAAIGDVEWLKQSLRDQPVGEINYDKNGLTALHLAAIHGRLNCLKLLIEKYKYDVNLTSTTGWRPIHLCISNQTGKRALQCLEYLLEKKADPSVANNDGITPMHQAASEGHVQCLKMLIDVGGAIDGKDCRNHTPLDLAKLWGHRNCSRIIAAEMWHQGKDHVTKEMQQLKKLKMQQVLRELEQEEEFKAAQEFYGENAFKQWLEKQNLPPVPTGPLSSLKLKTREETSKKLSSLSEALTKPNSVAAKAESAPMKGTKAGRRLDTMPIAKIVEEKSSQSLLTRKTTDLTQILEDNEVNDTTSRDNTVQDKRSRSPAFFNSNVWKIPLKVDDPPYISNLPDDYPRDMYTMMPKDKPGLKYYDGKHGPRVHDKDVIENADVDTKKKLRKPDLPAETIKQVMSKDVTLLERPIVFRTTHIHDVQAKKKYGDDIKGKSEVSLHLCDDMSSFLFRNSLKSGPQAKESGGGGASSKGSSSTSRTSTTSANGSSSGHWSSIRFPREKVINTLRSIAGPSAFPYMKGEEYDLATGRVF